MVTRDQVRTSTRMGGMVKRYPTWPTTQQQTVGEHSWQVMRIYLRLWGGLPENVARYILWHDVAEVYTGDLPFPLKRDNPVLKQEMDK